jgi:hypothetical protein
MTPLQESIEEAKARLAERIDIVAKLAAAAPELENWTTQIGTDCLPLEQFHPGERLGRRTQETKASAKAIVTALGSAATISPDGQVQFEHKGITVILHAAIPQEIW